MTHYRAEYRAAVTAALAASAAFASFKTQSAWAQKIDPGQLPCFAVATPREGSSREGGSTVHRQSTVQVAFRIDGNADIEGAMDDLSIEAEAVILPVLEGLAHIVALTSTNMAVDASGAKPVGVVILEFTAVRFTDAGSLN